MTEFVSGIARLLLLPTWTTAAAVLVRSYSDVGDGFSAGVIAATAVVLQYVAFGFERAREMLPLGRMLTVAAAGLALMALIAFGSLAAGLAPLSHWPPPGAHVAQLGELKLHTALAFDVGMALSAIGTVAGGLGAFGSAIRRRREEE